MQGEDLTRGFQSVHAGHGAIHDDDLWMKLGGEFDGFRTVARFADDGNVGLILENAAETAPDQGMIVDQQNGNFVRHFIGHFLKFR
jgi:hypothetical protein